ncbi:unnamed protein product, partial [marine sediment metagenome]
FWERVAKYKPTPIDIHYKQPEGSTRRRIRKPGEMPYSNTPDAYTDDDQGSTTPRTPKD